MTKLNNIIRENHELKQQIAQLIQTAKENEIIFKRFETIEFNLMACTTLTEFLDILILHYHDIFHIDSSFLLLSDADKSLVSLISDKDLYQRYQNRVLFFHKQEEIGHIAKSSENIYIGSFNTKIHGWIVQQQNRFIHKIKSIAILPLRRKQSILGMFCCCSQDATRFEAHSSNDFIVRIAQIISLCLENVVNYEKLKKSSLTDALTKIPNRRYFDQAIFEEINRIQRTAMPLSCLLIDIDHFKQVNDIYGHKVGDLVLQQVAMRINHIVRTHEIFARYGGEEFVILCPGIDNQEAEIVAQRVLKTINQTPIAIDQNKSLDITISIGISCLHKKIILDEVNHYCHALVEHADTFLYQAKNTGRNRYCNGGYL